MSTLRGRTIVVVGAEEPGARALARALAAEGAAVALLGVRAGPDAEFAIASIANELWALEVRHVMAPAGDSPDPYAQAERVRAELGEPDGLVSLAGDLTPWRDAFGCPAVDARDVPPETALRLLASLVG